PSRTSSNRAQVFKPSDARTGRESPSRFRLPPGLPLFPFENGIDAQYGMSTILRTCGRSDLITLPGANRADKSPPDGAAWAWTFETQTHTDPGPGEAPARRPHGGSARARPLKFRRWFSSFHVDMRFYLA